MQGNNPDIIEFKHDFSEENYRKLYCSNNLKLTRGKKKKGTRTNSREGVQ